MKSSQMLKGVLDGCVLMILREKPYYGYDLIDKLNGYGFNITQGTLYPLLIRMEKKGFVDSFYQESNWGPKRKYYQLTNEGEASVEEFMENISALWSVVGKVIEEYKGART